MGRMLSDLVEEKGEKPEEDHLLKGKSMLRKEVRRQGTEEVEEALRSIGMEEAEEVSVSVKLFGAATIPNGDLLRTTLNDAGRTSETAHHNSTFLTTSRSPFGILSPSAYSIGRAILVLGFPSHFDSPLLPLGPSTLAIVAEMYHEPMEELGMRWVDGLKERRKVLLPLEDVDELVFPMTMPEKDGVKKVWVSQKPTRDVLG